MEEQWHRVFENLMLIKIFGPKRDEATGKWKILPNEQLFDIFSSQDVIRVIK
jgi:hypothetical protein